MQGWRLEMEDAHISADFPSKPDHLLLVISNDKKYYGSISMRKQYHINIIIGCI